MWKPLEYANAIRKHWGALVTSGALVGGLGIWQGTGHVVSHGVYWAVVLAGLMGASYRAWAAEKVNHETTRSELERERSLHGGPEISFGWGAAPPLNTRTTLIIENSGSTDAYEVKVGDIGLNKTVCAARFPIITKCSKGTREPLKFQLTGNSVPPNHKEEFEMVVYASGADFSKDDEGREVVDFPITVTYEEYGGATYEANFRYVADTYLQEVNVHRVSRRRVN